MSARNRVGCVDCGGVVESVHRHDFVSCQCGGVAADGGQDYFKRSFKAAPPVELPDAASLLAFKLRMASRLDEAAVVEEHKP